MLTKEDVKNIVSKAKNEALEEQDLLIYTLHKIQEHYKENYIPPEVAEWVGEELNVKPSKIYEVPTFYTMFSTKPRGKYVIRVCTSLPCHVAGGREIIETLKDELKIDWNQTTKDGLFTLEETGCLGLCGVSPVIMINKDFYGDLTPEKVREIIRKLRGGDSK